MGPCIHRAISSPAVPCSATSAISTAEVRAVQDGVRDDVREDGRSLLQRRPVTVRVAESEAVDDGTNNNGSSVTVCLGGGTTVLATASPSVVSVPCDGEEGVGHGPLFITVDAAPAVVGLYASAIGGRSSRYRRTFLAHAALVISNVFGAERVVFEGMQSGVAEAQLLNGSDEEEEQRREGGGGDEEAPRGLVTARQRALSTGYPSTDLYVGRGYAIRIDVDVHVQQAAAGNLLAAVALAVHAALRCVRLPSVTLHVAAGRDGRVCLVRYAQYHPSYSGGARLQQLGGSGGAAPSPSPSAAAAAQLALHPADLLAVVGDATHICAAMVSACDEALEQTG